MSLIKHILYIFLLVMSIVSCNRHQQVETSSVSADSAIIQDTLHVALLQNPASFFILENEYYGIDYELIQQFAQKNKQVLKIHQAKTTSEMTTWLDDKTIDVLAGRTWISKDNKQKYLYVVPQSPSSMVLVQNIGVKTISDVLELKNMKISVVRNSIYHQRLMHLDEEIGGGIEFDLWEDTVTVDALIEKVVAGKIQMTLAHRNTAAMYKAVNRKLDINLKVGFEQHNGWLIRQDDEVLKQKLDAWRSLPETEQLVMDVEKRYYENNPFFASAKVRIPRGSISPYDAYFKKYASEIGWDWRLLASVAFHESRFDARQVSRAGAAGLMQLMPRTAYSFGLERSNVFDPESNIEAGVQYIKSLNLLYRKIEDKEERIKFILASYNSGPAHVLDAIALAQKYGKNPEIWYGHVEYFLKKKSEPEFYRDAVVKNGYFRSGETVRYVNQTLETYQKYLDRR